MFRVSCLGFRVVGEPQTLPGGGQHLLRHFILRGYHVAMFHRRVMFISNLRNIPLEQHDDFVSQHGPHHNYERLHFATRHEVSFTCRCSVTFIPSHGMCIAGVGTF